ncbi:MAG: translation elongation factor 4 [Acidimicrobiales bacterium]|nr:translation elongation factor 4 [Acidimicrobiales bacterium]
MADLTPLERIRNLAIIAHIDHGKTTLSDRLLEMTGAVEGRAMKEQFLDQMDIERERGITIKLQSVRLVWKDHIVNLIDTPGHVDFGYEVSRSLAACEGVVLIVDASQGIEAQTLANCYQALEHDLEIIAVLNKIDLPAAEPDRVAEEIEAILGIDATEVLHVSGKTGAGVAELLDAIIETIPPPTGKADDPLRALIFDSHYDTYRGVISSVRVMDGTLRSGDELRFMQAGSRHHADELGVRDPAPRAVDFLGPGETGYLIAGIKDVADARSGETVTTVSGGADDALAGYQDPKPMVFAGLFPVDGDEYSDLRDSLEKLRLNDGSFTYEPETSQALGFGFRCGFLGMLHMEIIRERLMREFDLNLITTAPSVAYEVVTVSGERLEVDSPSALPQPSEIDWIEEPMFLVAIITPSEYIGQIIELCEVRRGEQTRLEYLSPERIEVAYKVPLAEVVRDFFDQLKSRTQGYASLDYELVGYERADLVKVDVLLNGVAADAFSMIVHRDSAYDYGRRMAEKLHELIPRQMFDIPIQAAIGGKIIARETVKAKRKDVLSKCYGGDISRKRKLLEKQKEGKKKAKNIGRVEVPQEAFVSALRLDDE